MTTPQPRNKHFFIGFLTGLLHSPTVELSESQEEGIKDLIKHLNEQS